jgi:DNA-binding MarR family transcriptional regulator
MVETSQKERVDPMEVFLLAAIARGGLDSIYALQREVDLQPGNVLPLIKALIGDGMLTRTEQGRRRRKAIAITEMGEKFLVENWKRGLDSHRDIETVFRSATVALLMGDVGEAVTCLLSYSSEREVRSSAQSSSSISSSSGVIHLHSAMKSIYRQRRNRLEAKVSGEFGRSIAGHGLHTQLQTSGQSEN